MHYRCPPSPLIHTSRFTQMRTRRCAVLLAAPASLGILLAAAGHSYSWQPGRLYFSVSSLNPLQEGGKGDRLCTTDESPAGGRGGGTPSLV